VLGQLLPELGTAGGDDTEAPHVGGERGRFELLDALAQALCDAAREQALLIVIEDLHVADEATVSVLELLNQQARASQLFLVGTLRDADARLARAGGALMRLARGPRRIELERLGKAHVGAFLARSGGTEPSDSARDAVFRVTEGNPLFLVEVTRLLTERDWLSAESLGVAIPRNVRHTIRARLERLSTRARAALEVASVVGRQFRAQMLAELSERTLADLAAPLTEALDEGILTEVAPAEYRFSHVLLREVLHLDLSEERRAALHWDAADVLRRRLGSDAPWSEIAHHLLEAGAAAREAATAACSCAARDSEQLLAFPDAAEWYTRALSALGRDPSSDVERRGPLLLALAEAQSHAGDIAAGRATCMRAVGLARQLGDGELFARAALVYGTVLQYAVVDPVLIDLLEEATNALPPGPGKLRAVVMARLAAAQQPAPQPERWFELARQAIEMARGQADPGTLLSSMRYGISALMDLAAPSERLELNREYVRLAVTQAEPLEVLRGTMRQTFDQLELGDVAAVDASIEAIEKQTARFGHPFYVWRAHAFRAMQAIFSGQFADAERHMQRAEALGQDGRDASAATTVAFQRHMLLRCQGRDDEVRAAMPRLSQLLDGSELGLLSVRVMTAEALVRMGRTREAAAHLGPNDLMSLVGYGDVSTFAPMANVALALGLPDVADRALVLLEARPRAFVSGGMTTMLAGEPIDHVRATLHRAAGRLDLAEHCLGLALEQTRRAGALPFAAWVELDLATLISTQPARRSQARELALAASSAAARLGSPGLERRARALLEAEAARLPAVLPAPRDAASVSIERDGESWLVSWGDVRVRLADSKGMNWLRTLVTEPGREFHVLDLSAASGVIDAGDAGEVLDVRARQEYRQRLATIEADLAEARERNDVGRAARLQEELGFLERELIRALGLGGQQRRTGGASERARINVQRRLRDALRRITLQHAELGQRLERAIKTGLYCSYRP
jgi:tetratricopeptide (TPR) repeat protein